MRVTLLNNTHIMHTDQHKYSKKIADLILLYKEGKISKAQSKELNLWVEQKESHKKIFKDCIKDNFFDEALKESFLITDHQQIIWDQIKKRTLMKQKRIKLFRNLAAAASIIIILGFSISIFITDFKFFEQTAQVDFEPGQSKAILKLANGQKLIINADSSFSYISNEGTKIKSSGRKLSYSPLNTAKEVYNNLEVPRGAEQTIELSDGTIVHLNANSELRYPEAFIGNKRKVFLTGEAYFDVVHNVDRPFIVNVNGVNTKVLGTSFTVRYYEEEGKVITTLIDGKVEVSNQANSSILVPGQQSEISGLHSGIEVKDVDVDNFIGWHKGRIVYDNEPLDRILHDLARWYNFELFYDNASAKYIPFSCNLERYQNLSVVLTMLEKTNKVKFKLYESSLVVETIK